jgi:hypothetical protein
MKLKISAEDASWQLREAAWDLEERVLWRGSDAAKTKAKVVHWRLAKVGRAVVAVLERISSPVQQLFETKLVWPLTDRLDDYGPATKTGIVTLALVAALGATLAGAKMAGGGDVAAPAAPTATGGSLAFTADTGGGPSTLQGVQPDFAADPNTTAVAAKAVPPAPVRPEPTAPPAQIALGFAQAFAKYEVGKTDEKDTEVFAAVASPPLAQALTQSPPRLPAGTEVPQAKVLNVVLAEQEGKEIVASVSLLRLEAASELRLTLRDKGDGWRVVEVLG